MYQIKAFFLNSQKNRNPQKIAQSKRTNNSSLAESYILNPPNAHILW